VFSIASGHVDTHVPDISSVGEGWNSHGVVELVNMVRGHTTRDSGGMSDLEGPPTSMSYGLREVSILMEIGVKHDSEILIRGCSSHRLDESESSALQCMMEKL
jgi:hypothetical protein